MKSQSVQQGLNPLCNTQASSQQSSQSQLCEDPLLEINSDDWYSSLISTSLAHLCPLQHADQPLDYLCLPRHTDQSLAYSCQPQHIDQPLVCKSTATACQLSSGVNIELSTQLQTSSTLVHLASDMELSMSSMLPPVHAPSTADHSSRNPGVELSYSRLAPWEPNEAVNSSESCIDDQSFTAYRNVSCVNSVTCCTPHPLIYHQHCSWSMFHLQHLQE